MGDALDLTILEPAGLVLAAPPKGREWKKCA